MQHRNDYIYESLTHETPDLESQSLDTVENALRRELHSKDIGRFNVARAFRMIEDGLYRKLPGYTRGSDDEGNAKGIEAYYRAMPECIGVPKQTVSHMRKVANAINHHATDFLTYNVDPKRFMRKLARRLPDLPSVNRRKESPRPR